MRISKQHKHGPWCCATKVYTVCPICGDSGAMRADKCKLICDKCRLVVTTCFEEVDDEKDGE